MNTIKIGQRMKEIRERKGMSRPTFARYYGIPKNTQRNYENGDFPSALLDALHTYHNVGKVSYDFLLDGKTLSLEDAELFSKLSLLSTEQKDLVKRYISLLSDTKSPK